MVMRHCCRAHYHSHDETIVGSFLAASYVDRILRGEKPGDLPVQAQTRLAMVINPDDRQRAWSGSAPTLLIRADEVIE